MKPDLRYVKIIPVYLLALTSIGLPVLFAKGTAIPITDNLMWYLFFQLVFLFTIGLLWKKVIFDINNIEVTNTEIRITNLLTKKVRIIQRDSLIGFKDSFWNGYTVKLIDKEGKTVAKLYEEYYRNFKDLLITLNLDYLK
ncbi:hypothetical protein I0P70_20575 [Pontibacter sp. FD36]|uniref:hypothetical protein n=1 Tax=Pontibacter sp. FD36 TaxID=2789860 RepID=UPI0018AA6462|nr:hypothetical protein [Pontibacter sp. FD36]MBF8965659.1 hypothetical protein [Pontibacter sp. FD36]